MTRLSTFTPMFMLLGLLTTACGEGSSAVDQTSETDETGEPDSPYTCEDPGVQEFQPLSGVGYDPVQGLLDPDQSSYVVHTTQILVAPEAMPQFIADVQAIAAQLAQTEGLVAYGLGSDTTCGFQRTIGIWRDTTSMFAFVGSGAHAEAMSHTLELSSTGKTTFWTLDASEFPIDWDDAKLRLAEVEPSGLYD